MPINLRPGHNRLSKLSGRPRAQRVPCPECKGAGNSESTAMDEGGHITQEWTTCQRCQGKGNIQATIAGARLGERGVTLRIE